MDGRVGETERPKLRRRDNSMLTLGDLTERFLALPPPSVAFLRTIRRNPTFGAHGGMVGRQNAQMTRYL
jgi:hypothetical protein